MADPAVKEDSGLSPDVLEHALAFKGNSAQVFADAVEEVKLLAANGDLYPPASFPTWREPVPESTIRTRLESISPHGRLTQAEAVSLLMLLHESSALLQAFGQSWETADWETAEKINKVLGKPTDFWQIDVIVGITKFGSYMSVTSGTRDRVLKGDGRPTGHTMGEVMQRDWWDKFVEPIKKDGMILGRNTALAVKKTVEESAETEVRQIPESAKTDKEIRDRIESQKYGAKLGFDLYLESLDLASKQLPYKLDIKTVKPGSPKALR